MGSGNNNKRAYIATDHPVYSPWPFRASAENGQIHEHYTAHVIGGIKLFDELIRLKDQLNISEEQVWNYKKTREFVWNWLYSMQGPMRTFIWKGYFEDMPNDKYDRNRLRNIPLETARYILENPGSDQNTEVRIPALIYWVASVFETEDNDAIKEQFGVMPPWEAIHHVMPHCGPCGMNRQVMLGLRSRHSGS